MKCFFLIVLFLLQISCKHNLTVSQTKNVTSNAESAAVDTALAEVFVSGPGDGEKFWRNVEAAVGAGRTAEASSYALYFALHRDAWTPVMAEGCAKADLSAPTLNSICELVTVLQKKASPVSETASDANKSLLGLIKALNPDFFAAVDNKALYKSFSSHAKAMNPSLRAIATAALVRNSMKPGRGPFTDETLEIADGLVTDVLKSADALKATFTQNTMTDLKAMGIFDEKQQAIQPIDLLLSSLEQHQLGGMLSLASNGTPIVLKVSTDVWNSSLNIPDIDFFALYIATKASPLSASSTVKLAETVFDSDSLRSLKSAGSSVRAFSEKFHRDFAERWGCEKSLYLRCPILQRFYSTAALPLYWMLGSEASRSGAQSSACNQSDASGQSVNRQACWVYQFISFFQDESMTAAVFKDGEYTLNLLSRAMASSSVTSHKEFKDDLFMNKGVSQSSRRTAVMNYLCNEYSFLSAGAGWSSDEGVPEHIVRPFAHFSRLMFAGIVGNDATAQIKAEFSDRHRVAPSQGAYCFEDMFLTRVDEPVRNYMVDYIYNDNHFQKVGP